MQYLSYHDIGALQGTCTLVANLIMGTPVSHPVRSMRLYANMTQALWDMSNGRFNYSEFTQDEFNFLKEAGDAEAGDKQGNNPVSLLHFRRKSHCVPCVPYLYRL